MNLTLDQALQKGIEAYKAGKIQEADRYYTAILKANPKHPDANHNMGVLAVGIGKVEEALPFFKTALEANSSIAQYWLSYIDSLIKLDRMSDAKEVFDQAKSYGFKGDAFDQIVKQLAVIETTFNPPSSTQEPPQGLLQNLINLYTQAQYQEVMIEATKLLLKFPTSMIVYNIIGAANQGLGKLDEAIDAYKKALAIKPDYAEAYYNMGNALKEQGKLEEAIQAYNKAFSIKPDYAEAYYNMGITFQDQGKLEEAIEAFTKALAIKPDYAEAYNNMGNALKKQGKLEEAIQAYNKAFSIKPDFAEAYNNVGNTFQDQGKLEEAIEAYNKALAIKPDYAEAYYNMGDALKEQGKLEEAIQAYNKAFSIKPDYAEAYNNVGNTLKELGKLDEALASYKKAIALKPHFEIAHINLGKMFQKLGRLEDAIHHFDLGGYIAFSNSLECLYINKNYSEFYRRIDSISESDPKNISVASVSAFVAHQLGRKDPYPFCANPLDFVQNKNVIEYEQNADKLMDDIVKEADKYKLEFESRTSKNGFQGQLDFFDHPSENTAKLESIIVKVTNEYYHKFKHESNSFIQLWPEKRKVTGWYNRLLKNGYHTAHIHATGWLSGVIYLKTVESFDDDEGAIELSLHGNDLPIINENFPRKIHRPKRGDIILFPSSLFHRTIPFTQDTERCTVAFDIQKK